MYKLKIPFKMNFSHAKADRGFSDSIILRLTGKNRLGKTFAGWGEAVVREYVSGEIASAEELNLSLKNSFTDLLEPFRSKPEEADRAIEKLKDLKPDAALLPLLCAVETAILDLMCREGDIDIYTLLGSEPLRAVITYGGTLPILPLPAAEKLLTGYKQMKIGNLRIKLGGDLSYNRSILQLARSLMGEDYDLKTDTNAGWTLEEAAANMSLLKEFGVHIVEEPFGREENPETGLLKQLMRKPESAGMLFMADESALTVRDIEMSAASGTFGMINIRLAKNGGIFKSLEMAETAERLGLKYMCGCHVGETGILSAAGRVASSLMKDPVYTDGSYDSHLLSGNITAEDLSFGKKGKAEIIRDRGIGFHIDETKLEGYINERIGCF